MAIKIVYIETQPTWESEPGRLYVPVPRDADEAGEAVKKLIAKGDVEQIRIEITTIEK